MKLAIVSVEDRRFADHQGVDWQGTLRAFLTNTTSGQVEQGAAAINEQYVKTNQLLVLATTDSERRAAIDTTTARQIRKLRMVSQLEPSPPKAETHTHNHNQQ